MESINHFFVPSKLNHTRDFLHIKLFSYLLKGIKLFMVHDRILLIHTKLCTYYTPFQFSTIQKQDINNIIY